MPKYIFEVIWKPRNVHLVAQLPSQIMGDETTMKHTEANIFKSENSFHLMLLKELCETISPEE
jgi:hypothetical protein